MSNVSGISSRKSPKQFLQEIVDDENMPKNIRADAAKSLLPYTAKKTSETLETRNFNYNVELEALKVFDDTELATFLALLKKLTPSGSIGEGDTEKEVPDDH